jgi:hypothetical protein
MNAVTNRQAPSFLTRYLSPVDLRLEVCDLPLLQVAREVSADGKAANDQTQAVAAVGRAVSATNAAAVQGALGTNLGVGAVVAAALAVGKGAVAIRGGLAVKQEYRAGPEAELAGEASTPTVRLTRHATATELMTALRRIIA